MYLKITLLNTRLSKDVRDQDEKKACISSVFGVITFLYIRGSAREWIAILTGKPEQKSAAQSMVEYLVITTDHLDFDSLYLR